MSDFSGNKFSLPCQIGRGMKSDYYSLRLPMGFNADFIGTRLKVFVLADELMSHIQDGLRGTEVHRKRIDFSFKLTDVFNIGSSKSIDRLLVISHHRNISHVRIRNQAY